MSIAIRVRETTPADSEALSRLSAQLGYPSDAAAIARRLREMQEASVGTAFIAETDEGDVVAAICMIVEYSMVGDRRANVAELIVEERFRGRGIGATLLRTAETWAREMGFDGVRVNSNVVRERAHRFYLREGYAEKKRQSVFVKQLD